MSVAAESPVNSSSSDDYAAILEAELESDSSDISLNQHNSRDDADDVIHVEVGDERIKRRKMTVLDSTVEAQASTSYGPTKKDLDDTIKDSCTHPGFIGDMCVKCGTRTDDVGGVAFAYIHKDLRLGTDEISRLRNADMRSLLRRKKLYLVLDLDHTLLNSTLLEDISSEEAFLWSATDSLQEIAKGNLFRLDMMRMMTKLRPFVRTFLQEASSMFEMYIYTMGERAYAVEMAKLLDPESLYFNSRVISRADCTQKHQKGLDIVLGQDSAVLILDDTEKVWENHQDNLILIERYHFFSSSCRQHNYHYKSLSEQRSDENELDGVLARVLGALKRIHSLFFDPENGDDYASRDVRQVLKQVRKETLKDCKIVLSKIFPNHVEACEQGLWKMAEELGASCSTELSASITHVVSADAGTEKSRWAVQEGKFLVNQRWIEAAKFLWERQPEDRFPVDSTTKKRK